MGLLDQVLGGALGSAGGRASPTSPMVKALLLLLAAKAVQHYNTPRSAGQAGQPQPHSLPHGGAAGGGGGFGSGGAFSGIPGFPAGGQASGYGQGGGYGGQPGGYAGGGGQGGIGDLLGGLLGGRGGPLGGMLGGGGPAGGMAGRGAGLGSAAVAGGLGGLLAGGLGSLLQGMHQRGLGDVAESWVGHGQNRAVDPRQLADAIGPETLGEISRETGLSEEEFLPQLSQMLPSVVDQLTPDGRLPTDDEADRWV